MAASHSLDDGDFFSVQRRHVVGEHFQDHRPDRPMADPRDFRAGAPTGRLYRAKDSPRDRVRSSGSAVVVGLA